MEVSAFRAGFSAERIERIAAHLNKNYIDSGKIAGCQVLVARRGQLAYVSGEGELMETRPAREHVTFRHLLTHTAGLTYGGGPIADADLQPVDRVYRSLDIGVTSSVSL